MRTILGSTSSYSWSDFALVVPAAYPAGAIDGIATFRFDGSHEYRSTLCKSTITTDVA